MRKAILILLPVILFPYFAILAMLFSFNFFDSAVIDFLVEHVFFDNGFLILFVLFLLWLIGMVCAVLFSFHFTREWQPVELAKVSLLIKLIQIPAYIVIFLLGLCFMVTIFTFAFSFLMVLFAVMSILLSGLIGACAVKKSYSAGILPQGKALLLGVLQFIFCLDVVSAAVLLGTARGGLENEDTI